LASVLQYKKQCLWKAEFFFFCEKNEMESSPWKKEIGGQGAACPKIFSTAGRLEAKCFFSP